MSISLNVPWQGVVTYLGMRRDAETSTELGDKGRRWDLPFNTLKFCLTRSSASKTLKCRRVLAENWKTGNLENWPCCGCQWSSVVNERVSRML